MKEIRIMKRIPVYMKSVWLVILVSVIYLSSCDMFQQEFTIGSFYEGEDESISEYVIAKADTFSHFKNALMKAGLEKTLSARNPNGNNYTLFLPTNEAFESFVTSHSNYTSMDDLMADASFLNALIQYHVVNGSYQTNDFPFGALPDTTISGNLLTIGYAGGWDSTVYRINNIASVIRGNIEVANGYIHVIDNVLQPVVDNSYEWLQQHPDYSIFTKALEVTGLRDTFFLANYVGGLENYSKTLLVESNDVLAKKDIYSIGDLQAKYSPGAQNYTEYSNGLYQFVAYHILEGEVFLNDFEDEASNYNTHAALPVFIDGREIDIMINRGVEVFDTVITGNQDTIPINFIKIKYDESNVLSRNGAIHFIDNVMEPYRPPTSSRTFSFYEEPVIREARNFNRSHLFTRADKGQFRVISWEGVERMFYSYQSGSGANNNDYLSLYGNFVIHYQIPKILAGDYLVQIRAHTASNRNANVQVFFDGKRIGGNVDLTQGTDKWGHEFNWLDVGSVSIEEYTTHTVTVRSLISGSFRWDQIRFQKQN